MSSSSGPDERATPHLDVAEIEQVEELEGTSAERALGTGQETRARGRREALITAAWAAPGTLWLFFFLRRAGRDDHPRVLLDAELTGFEKTFTLENYRTLFGSYVYWNQLKDSFFVALIVVGACLLSASRSPTS